MIPPISPLDHEQRLIIKAEQSGNISAVLQFIARVKRFKLYRSQYRRLAAWQLAIGWSQARIDRFYGDTNQ
jgi:hypothetical protein